MVVRMLRRRTRRMRDEVEPRGVVGGFASLESRV
jgi:hypothetical protein